jgi:hypothetical protein
VTFSNTKATGLRKCLGAEALTGKKAAQQRPLNRRDPMKQLLVIITLLTFAGCSTMQPLVGSSVEQRTRINSGELLKTGDYVVIVTTDDSQHEFTVTAIRDDTIYGKGVSIAVDQVVSVEKRAYSGKVTWWTVGSTIAALGALSIYGLTHDAGNFNWGGSSAAAVEGH